MMRKTPTHHMSGRVAGLSRFIVVAPVIGLFVAAVALTALASIDVVRIILEVLQRESSLKLTLVAFIEVADVYLLSIVLYIISLGLYELFIDENVALPRWLQIHTLEDLKEKLVSVVVVVLAVFTIWGDELRIWGGLWSSVQPWLRMLVNMAVPDVGS